MKNSVNKDEKPPDWILRLQEKGFEPYIATSRKLVPHLNVTPFGQNATLHVMDEMDDASFLQAYFLLEAYLLSNSLSYESPNLKMPHWVLIDCVLMQTAVVGFTVAKNSMPNELLAHYREDEKIAFDKLDRIPVSGQISATNIGNDSMTGISLFSLGRRWLKTDQKLGLYTKALALEVYRAGNHDFYYGITQYDNTSLRIHGRFTDEMEIDLPMVLLHPGKEMTFIYKMKLRYDHRHPGKAQPETEPTFWLNAHDTDKKHAMHKGIKEGKRYIIAPPYCVRREGAIFLPIIEKEARA
jgi:hypothetical protein